MFSYVLNQYSMCVTLGKLEPRLLKADLAGMTIYIYKYINICMYISLDVCLSVSI